MKVLLTGGTGSVGKAVINQLAIRGISARVIGRREGQVVEGAEYQPCDVTDYPRLREVISGCEAVIHLAAIAWPGGGTPEQIFQANCQGTFNVFQAAAEEGIRRVVQASSINAAGQFFGTKPAPIHYLPFDEEHPTYPTDAYSFSKNVIEYTGRYFWEREGISSVALRLPAVVAAGSQERYRQNRPQFQALVDRLLKMSREERLAWFETTWKDYNDFRATRPNEIPGRSMEVLNSLPEERRLAWKAMIYRVHFFTVVDERDSAQSIVKALVANFSGCHNLFINDSLNHVKIESSLLAELFYPDVTTFKRDLSGTTTMLSIDRARELIGYEPEYSFGL
jgi:nucleoside-diphosphate-sugar epimerase